MAFKINTLDSNSTLNIVCNTEFSNQIEFTNVAPHCSIVPEYGNDICNKAYVDSHIASGGNNFLYFNYSADASGALDASNVALKKIGSSIVITTETDLSRNQLGTQKIASFITDIGIPYITTIPSGIWTLNQFGMCDGTHDGTLYYYFKLLLYKPSTTSYREIGTSGYSDTVDALTPALYFATLSLGETSCELEERVVIEVWSVGVNTGNSTFNSYYQGSHYSYITCPLLIGANLLNLNNSWTGSNSFSQPVSVPNTTYPSNNTTVANTTYLTNYVNVADTQTISGVKTFTQTPVSNGTLSVDSSNNSIPTTSWVKSALNYLKSTENVWLIQQTFTQTPVSLGELLTSDESSKLSTTAWVTAKLISVLPSIGQLAATNLWTNVNTFSQGINSSKIDTNTSVLNIGTVNASTINIGSASKVVMISGSVASAITTGTITAPSAVHQTTTLNYSTLPTFTSSQIGYTAKAFLTTTTALPATGVGNIPCNVPISMGVWHISYSIRIVSTGTTTFTKIETFMTYNTSSGLPTSDPIYYGTNSILNTTIVTSSDIYAVSGSGVIFNPVLSKIIQLYCIPTYTTIGVPYFIGMTTTPVTFLTATRIG